VARAVAERYGTTHHTIDLGERGVSVETVIDLLRHFDQPFADTSCIPMYGVSAAVRERGIICTLSGTAATRPSAATPLLAGEPAREPHAHARRGSARRARCRRVAGGTHARLGPPARPRAQLAEGGRGDSAVLLDGLSNYLTEPQKAELVVAPARDALLPSYRHFDGYEPRGVRDIESSRAA